MEDNISLPFFYVIFKTHKTPIAMRPISDAFNLFFSDASRLCSNVFGYLYRSFYKKLREEGQEFSFAICINTEMAIFQASKAVKKTQIYCMNGEGTLYYLFLSLNFDLMYNNLDVE